MLKERKKVNTYFHNKFVYEKNYVIVKIFYF